MLVKLTSDSSISTEETHSTTGFYVYSKYWEEKLFTCEDHGLTLSVQETVFRTFANNVVQKPRAPAGAL